MTLTFSIDIGVNLAISHSGAIYSVLLVLGRFLLPEVSILIQNQTILLTKHVYGAKKLLSLSLVSSYYYVFGPKGGASASIAPPLNPPLEGVPSLRPLSMVVHSIVRAGFAEVVSAEGCSEVCQGSCRCSACFGDLMGVWQS